MLYIGQSLEEVAATRRLPYGGFADLLEPAFRAARLDPPPGLSPVRRTGGPSGSGGVTPGCAGLPRTRVLAESLLQLAFRLGDFECRKGPAAGCVGGRPGPDAVR